MTCGCYRISGTLESWALCSGGSLKPPSKGEHKKICLQRKTLANTLILYLISLSWPLLVASTTHTMTSLFFNLFVDEPDGPPPGSPPTRELRISGRATVSKFADYMSSDKFTGPWFTTQLMLSATIGVTSFLLFSYCRTRWPLLFAPRTKLKGVIISTNSVELISLWYLGFSPHEAHAHQAFLGWILPTIRTSEFTVLQIVGLDAAVVSTSIA